MRNLEKLTLFFQAENQRDWKTYQNFLHPEIIWELHGQEVSTIHGIDDYLLKIQQVYHHSILLQLTKIRLSPFSKMILVNYPVIFSDLKMV